MKTHLLLLPLLATCPVLALAQPKAAPTTTAPQISIDPAAQALMDKATATYKAAKGIRFEVETSENGKIVAGSSVAFSRPNLLSVELKNSLKPQRTLGDGSSLYIVQGKSFQKFPIVDGQGQMPVGAYAGGTAAAVIDLMLKGQNPLSEVRRSISSIGAISTKVIVSALPKQAVDGSIASGVRLDFAFKTLLAGKLPTTESPQIIFWFGDDSTLRRVQFKEGARRYSAASARHGATSVVKERVFNQQLNPTFALDTFKFDPKGLTLEGEDKSRP